MRNAIYGFMGLRADLDERRPAEGHFLAFFQEPDLAGNDRLEVVVRRDLLGTP